MYKETRTTRTEWCIRRYSLITNAKIFTKMDAKYSKKVWEQRSLERKVSKIFKFYGVYIML